MTSNRIIKRLKYKHIMSLLHRLSGCVCVRCACIQQRNTYQCCFYIKFNMLYIQIGKRSLICHRFTTAVHQVSNYRWVEASRGRAWLGCLFLNARSFSNTTRLVPWSLSHSHAFLLPLHLSPYLFLSLSVYIIFTVSQSNRRNFLWERTRSAC